MWNLKLCFLCCHTGPATAHERPELIMWGKLQSEMSQNCYPSIGGMHEAYVCIYVYIYMCVYIYNVHIINMFILHIYIYLLRYIAYILLS